ncbi:MAG: flavin reductase family protein [Caldisericia bacterium]|nr:flavin reductase family protein [Caldisericia bacterium]
MDLTALFKINYGLYIISSKFENKLNGQIANAVMQVTSEPPKIAICLNKNNLTHEFIEKSRIFTISILSKETPLTFIGHFGFKSGRDIDKFKDVNFIIGEKTGAPIVKDYTVAFIECKVIEKFDVGTHTIFIGEVLNCDKLSEDEPMTYAYYHEVKKGKASKNAPTFIKENKNQGG